mgnify:CR=1 FL=1
MEKLVLPKVNFGSDKELEEKYNQLTDENKLKFLDYYFQLLAEQEEEEKKGATV